MDDFTWTRADSHFLIALLWGFFGFMLYYLLSTLWNPAGRIWRTDQRLDPTVSHVLLQRIVGFLILGVTSYLLILLVIRREPAEFGAGIRFQEIPPWWTSLLVPLILITGYIYSPGRGHLERYPQFRISYWTPAMLLLSGISLVIYTAGYEFFFRGLLLHAALDVMSPRAAVALNCLLYAAAHLNKGLDQTIGAVPVGILLCYFTMVTGNIWTAVLLHSFIALSNEWFSIWRNRDLLVKR